MFKREMEMQLEGLTFQDNLMPVNQFWSMPLTFALLGSGSGNQPFKTVKDYDDFLKRMDAYLGGYWDCHWCMQRGMALGITPPKILMERVLPQLKAMDVKDVKQSVFMVP